MANQFLTISMITREALRVLENNIVFTKQVRRDFDDKYGVEGAKIGTVLNIRKPPRYVGRTGQALQIEDATETSVPLTLNTQRGVDIAVTSQDMRLSIDDFSERFLTPALASISNGIDFDGMQQFANVYNEIGTPGTVPNQLLTYLQAAQRLDEEAAPRDMNRALIISPAMQATIVDALKGLFQDSASISDQYLNGTMGKTIGFKWAMDQNVPTHSVGAYVTAGLTNGANQTGSSIITNTWGAAAANVLNVGDVITIAGVHAVNPQNRQSTGALRQFVITQTATTVANAVTIQIAGPGGLGIITAGPFQNVDAPAANGAAITVQGATGAAATARGLAFHKEAFAMASADLPLPGGVDKAYRAQAKKLGLSVRIIRAYDINTDRWPTRTDVLYGWATLYPELACRVAS